MGIGGQKLKQELIFYLILAAIAGGIFVVDISPVNKLLGICVIVIVVAIRLKKYIKP